MNTHEPAKRTKLRRPHWFTVLLGVVAVGVGVGMISGEQKSRVPIYEGKTLDQWLEMKGGIEPLPDEAQEAVRKIGTNAIPHLLALMEHEDAAVKSFLYLHLPDVWNLRGYLTPHYVIQDRGVEGIKALGPAAKPILPVLTKLLYEKSRFDAAEALVAIGDEGKKSSRAVWTARTPSSDTVQSLCCQIPREYGLKSSRAFDEP